MKELFLTTKTTFIDRAPIELVFLLFWIVVCVLSILQSRSDSFEGSEIRRVTFILVFGAFAILLTFYFVYYIFERI